MAKVSLILRAKKQIAPLYVRFVDGRNTDIWCKTKILVDPANWDNKKEQLRNLQHISNRDVLNASYLKLKSYVIEKHNEAYMLGDVFDKEYLNESISSFFKRPTNESKKGIVKHMVYYVDFANWWINEHSGEWKTDKNKLISEREIKKYRFFVTLIEDFQNKKTVKLRNVGYKFIGDFVEYLETEKNYSESTVKRHVSRLKFFLNRAETFNILLDKSYKNKVYVTKTESIEEPYFSEQEINKLYNLDLSHDQKLDNVRDNLIIGCWTGLRVSDFNNNLDISNIEDDYIKIQTQKTSTWVTIPLHPQVKEILKKRYRNLPSKISDQKFNIHIKQIAMLCDIDEVTRGVLFDSKTKRNQIGNYEKYKLVSSHICRRSFCTNLYGKVPNLVIMQVAGWSNEKQMIQYVKQTKKESADIILREWNK